MPEVSKAVLKTYFEDGKEPDESKYIDLVDTLWEQGGGVSDHGGLTGLADDDHTQYLLANGSRIVSGGLAIGAAHPQSLVYGHLFVHDGSVNDYGFIEAEGNLYLASNAYFDGATWRAIKAGKAAVLNIALANGLLYRGDTTTRSAGEALALTNRFGIDLSGNSYITGGLYVGSSSPVTTIGRIKATENLYLGGGIVVGYVSGTPDPDGITFYYGAVRMGEINAVNTAWLRINSTTNKPIYSPRYMRIDGGVSVTSSISDPGAGMLAAQRVNIYESGTLVGDFQAADTTWLRINRTSGKNVYSQRSIVIAGGLMSGTSYLPGGGYTGYTVALRPYKNTTGYTTYSYHPYTTKKTSGSFNGDPKSTTGATKIDLSAVFGIPAYVKAVQVRIFTRDSGGHILTGQYLGVGPSAADPFMVTCRPLGNDSISENSGMCTCDSNGDIYWRCGATGGGTLDIWIEINGYCI